MGEGSRVCIFVIYSTYFYTERRNAFVWAGAGDGVAGNVFANFCTGVSQMRISLKPLLASMYCGRRIFVEANSRLLF